MVGALGIVTGLACLALGGSAVRPAGPAESLELEGIEPGDTKLVPAVQAAFELESYRPGERARLVIRHRSKALTMQVFESGPERVPTLTDTEMSGVSVTRERPLGRVSGRRVVTLPIRRWESGLYFVRLRAADGRLGFAPFVVAPRRLGEHRVAVVLPTLTWQAYNFRDDDGDGKPDTWYAGKQENTVRLGRAVPRSRRALRLPQPPRIPQLAPLDAPRGRLPLAVGPRAGRVPGRRSRRRTT